MFAIKRARQAVQRAVVAALGRARLTTSVPSLLVDLHPRGHLLGELAERAVRPCTRPGEIETVDAGRKLDGLFTDSTHGSPDEADDLAADALLLRPCGS